jgi:hypothetical protein
MSRNTNKYKKKKQKIEEIKNRVEKKTKQNQARTIMSFYYYCKNFFRTNKYFEMHIFQVYERS